jgi:hypothetical protein
VKDLIVPADIAARLDTGPDDDVAVEMDADGVRVVRDALRTVYVETTSRCNLECAMCVHHGWRDPLGHMPLARRIGQVANDARSLGQSIKFLSSPGATSAGERVEHLP